MEECDLQITPLHFVIEIFDMNSTTQNIESYVDDIDDANFSLIWKNFCQYSIIKIH